MAARVVREIRGVRVLGKAGLRGGLLEARGDGRLGLAGLGHCLAVGGHYCGACVCRGGACCGLRVAGRRGFVRHDFAPRGFGNCVVVRREAGAHRHRVVRVGARLGWQGLAARRLRTRDHGRRAGRLRELGRNVWAGVESRLVIGCSRIRPERMRGGWIPELLGQHPVVSWRGSPVFLGLRLRWLGPGLAR